MSNAHKQSCDPIRGRTQGDTEADNVVHVLEHKVLAVPQKLLAILQVCASSHMLMSRDESESYMCVDPCPLASFSAPR